MCAWLDTLEISSGWVQDVAKCYIFFTDSMLAVKVECIHYPASGYVYCTSQVIVAPSFL